MTHASVYAEGLREAERHKWIESQKRGCDLGAAALADWYHLHWLPYCRSKRLEHLHGTKAWSEFGEDDFGIIGQAVNGADLLVQVILEHARNGWENLDVIVWAQNEKFPMDRVIDILEKLDLNRARLDPIIPRYAQP